MSLRDAASRAWRLARDIARRAAGVPDYEAYLRHCAAHHRDAAPLTRAAFFAERQDARYRGTGGRCC
jgi:uncharacterized short protein YbdD (DUF466 family)